MSPQSRQLQPRQHQRIVRRRARPHPRARPPAALEAGPAARPAVEVRLVQHARELQRREGDAGVVGEALCVHVARVREERDGRRGEAGEDRARVRAEEERGRAHADFHVVVLVLRGVGGLVSKRQTARDTR